MDINKCLEEGYLVKEKIDKNLIDKEISESRYDYEKAQKAFGEKDYKWTIIKSYYSMFHSAKAICFKFGYREKRHIAVLVVLEELNKQGKLEIKYINDFKAAISARESADYRYNYTKERAFQILEICKEFNERLIKLIQKA
ncbi:MAG: HEPN domain-containing protein [Nanoarchaeota archaeon]|nr:HEPN domain-containing protein [Nanoarchaeota archaeon]